MRSTEWAGMITNASPHSLPIGATVDQVNIGTEVAGQLTTRGGMRTIIPVVNGAYDVHPYVNGGYFYAIYMDSTGLLTRAKGPVYGAVPSGAAEPSLTASGNQAGLSYTQRLVTQVETI